MSLCEGDGSYGLSTKAVVTAGQLIFTEFLQSRGNRPETLRPPRPREGTRGAPEAIVNSTPGTGLRAQAPQDSCCGVRGGSRRFLEPQEVRRGGGGQVGTSRRERWRRLVLPWEPLWGAVSEHRVSGGGSPFSPGSAAGSPARRGRGARPRRLVGSFPSPSLWWWQRLACSCVRPISASAVT